MYVDIVQENGINVQRWRDADFAADKGDWKSVTGVVVILGKPVVQWFWNKQTDVSLSTMEAEITAAFHVGRELLCIQELAR